MHQNWFEFLRKHRLMGVFYTILLLLLPVLHSHLRLINKENIDLNGITPCCLWRSGYPVTTHYIVLSYCIQPKLTANNSFRLKVYTGRKKMRCITNKNLPSSHQTKPISHQNMKQSRRRGEHYVTWKGGESWNSLWYQACRASRCRSSNTENQTHTPKSL